MWRIVRASFGAILGLTFLFLSANLGCFAYGTAGNTKVIPHAITLMISSNTTSNFAPCGCRSGQWGGMPRRGTIFQEVEDEVSWPVLFVDTGNVTQGSTSESQKLKDEYIFQAYEVLDYDVVNVGINDLRLGLDELVRISEGYSIPWTSANTYEQDLMPELPVTAPVPGGVNRPGSTTDPVNPADTDESNGEIDYEPAAAPEFSPIFASYRIAEHQDAPGFRIGFIGAMVHDAARLNLTVNFSFEAYIDAIQRQVDYLRNTEKVDLVILISDADNLNNITPGTLNGIDIVIGGSTRVQASPNASLNPANPSYRPPVQTNPPVSNPTGTNPAGEEVSEGADADAVGEETVLEPLQLPMIFPKASSRGRIINRIDIWFDSSGQIVDYSTRDYRVDNTNEDDPRMVEIARGYDNDILSVDLNRQVIRTFAGSLACETCHPGYIEAWQNHGHFNSYDTIDENGSLDDRTCTECHAIGYVNKPRLLTYDLVPDTHRNVGCEGCHNNGGTHVQLITHLATLDPSVRGDFSANDTMSRPIPISRCTECHTGRWGANFNYDSAMATARAICRGVTTSGATLDDLHQ